MPTSDKDLVRLLISDVGGDSGTDFIFHDDEVEAFLSMESDNKYRAAAVALRTLAANEALVQKRIKVLELSTDGAATAEALTKLAAGLEARADVGEEADTDFEIANMGDSPFVRRNLRLGLEDLD